MRGRPLAALAAMSLAAPAGSEAATESAGELLDRHRPVLVHDRDERSFPVAVAGAPVQGRLRLGSESAVYGRLARGGDGRRWLQYWLFYARNDQDRGVLRTGRHEGDWELVQIGLDRAGRPQLATLSQHSWAEGCRFEQLERRGPAPVLYVANGSHALYARAGVGDRPFPDPDDEAGGGGLAVRPSVRLLDGRREPWLRWPGRWGRSRASWVPGEQSSPPGPAFQGDSKWEDPSAYHAALARPCGSGPPGRWWQPALLALVALAAIAALGRRLSAGRRGS